MEELTNRVTERVASRMEKRIEEIFDKITSKGNNGNSDAQEAEVQHYIDTLNRNIQGTCNGEQNHDNNNVVVSPEVLAVQTTVDKQIVGGQSAFVSCSLKTGGNIPDKIKQQIWAGKYIDFHSLFENDETKYRLQLVQGADNLELSFTEERNKKTLTLNQWLSAWNKLTAIICTKNPELRSVIPHHMEIILEMSREGGNWQFFDIEFRKLLERGEAQWGCTHLELYLRAKLQRNVKSGNDNNKSGNTRWPVGVCFPFHKGLGCKFGDKCKFQHRCFNCGFNHSFSTCKKPVRLPYKFTQTSNNSKKIQGGNNQPFRGPSYLVTETTPLPQGQKNCPHQKMLLTIILIAIHQLRLIGLDIG
ncbi:unnamed protein product [Mytilus coruscus]|uniref:C3H1-type domain-containing protein n=1 Tax=Mytilus coruscus TaxID=42192 RepID=A0A6J8CW57_MYTCO|nr:unnamed protein product [Mytilus coruscus]